MRILIDLTSLADNYSGIELYALSVAKELIKHKEVLFTLVFKNYIHDAFSDDYPNVEKIILKGNNKLLFNQFILPMKLHTIKADCYLFMAYTEPFFWLKHNTVNTIHDVSCWDCPASNKKHMILYWRQMFWKVAKRNGKIITVSEFSRGRISDILKVSRKRITIAYPAPSVAVMNNEISDAVDLEFISAKYNIPSQYMLCLSTLEPRKNLGLVVKAYEELVNEGETDLDLVLAGRKGWMTEELMGAVSANIKPKLHFTGFIDDNDLKMVYKMAQVFIFPSSYEGFGVPPLEAMSQGVPVVASAASAIPEVLGNAAILFSNGNKEDLKEKMKKCLFLTAEEKDVFLAEAQRTLSRYSWVNTAEIILAVCKQK